MGTAGATGVRAPGEGNDGGGRLPESAYFVVSSSFFETFGIPVRGRGFTAQDETDPNARVAVISETLARRLWSGGEALGRPIVIGANVLEHMRPAVPGSAPEPGASLEFQVIGVARDVRDGVMNTRQDFLYLPLTSAVADNASIYLRVRDHSEAGLATIARVAADKAMNVHFNRRIATRAQERLLPFLLMAWLSGAVGGLALLMASVGLYGVMAFTVNQRVREIGIRVALGATAQKIVRLFVRQGLRLVAIGGAIGLAGGALFALSLAKFKFGLGSVFDPVAFGGAALILGVVALAACWLPARRATKVDPMVALRCE
jgi:hypothetical protein